LPITFWKRKALLQTYHVVLLLHLMNAELSVPLWIWLCDALLSLTPLAAENISRSGGERTLQMNPI
jgi:hypothetical protein